ncbi:MAG: hypothetical protein R3C49_07280, partial [Planctomycetaceae bacterium]
MPVTPTYPGVYIEEIASGVRTISPVSTSLTAFVGGTPQGIANEPIKCTSFAGFLRKFGAIDARFPLGYAVSQYFLNGGSEALIVRVTPPDAVKAQVNANGLALEVVSAGVWGNQVVVRTDLDTKDQNDDDPQLFNLFAYDLVSGTLEEFRNLSTDPDNARYVAEILEDESVLIRVPADQPPSGRPGAHGLPEKGDWFEDEGARSKAEGGNDGSDLSDSDVLGNEL